MRCLDACPPSGEATASIRRTTGNDLAFKRSGALAPRVPLAAGLTPPRQRAAPRCLWGGLALVRNARGPSDPGKVPLLAEYQVTDLTLPVNQK
ncbi:hypothetical protein SNE510_75510 [Streptomyces sp. NE5-10]|nr:hypothetical protein SNE510_75510 [Streptomyces sp. NE5-10]